MMVDLWCDGKLFGASLMFQLCGLMFYVESV